MRAVVPQPALPVVLVMRVPAGPLLPDPDLRSRAARRRVPEFRSFCLAHRDELAALTGSRLVQTNEVRRCSYLLPAVTLAAPRRARAPRP